MVILSTIYLIRALLMKEGFWDDVVKWFTSWIDRVTDTTRDKFKGLVWVVHKMQIQYAEYQELLNHPKPQGMSISDWNNQAKQMAYNWGAERELVEMDKFVQGYKKTGDNLWKYFRDEVAPQYAEAGKVIVASIDNAIAAVGAALEQDSKAMLDGLGTVWEALPDGITVPVNDAMAQMQGFLKTLNDLKNIFMTEPLPAGNLTWKKILPDPALMAQINDRIADINARMKEMQAGIQALTVWQFRWGEAVKVTVQSMDKWHSKMVDVLETIRTEWGDTFTDILNDTSTKARTLENTLENMFDSILNSFNRMVSQVLASDLWYALFGQGKMMQPGTASLFFGNKVMGQSSGSGFGDMLMQSRNTQFGIPEFAGGLGMFANKTIPNTAINISNQGMPVTADIVGRRIVGDQYIVDVVMRAMDTDPSVRDRIRG